MNCIAACLPVLTGTNQSILVYIKLENVYNKFIIRMLEKSKENKIDVL